MTDHTTTTTTAEASTPDAHRSGARRLSANDVLGIPALPPGAVARGGTRMRAGVARVADVFAMPPVRILEGIFGLLDHRVLVALCEAGVPEALDRPTHIDDLAEQLAVDPDRLARLLRYAVAKRWLRTDRRGRIVPTAFTRFLHRDHPGGWRAWVEFAAGDEVLRAVGALSADAGDQDTFEAANGSPFFEWMADHPDRWRVFDQAMAAGGRMHGLALASTLRLEGPRPDLRRRRRHGRPARRAARSAAVGHRCRLRPPIGRRPRRRARAPERHRRRRVLGRARPASTPTCW